MKGPGCRYSHEQVEPFVPEGNNFEERQCCGPVALGDAERAGGRRYDGRHNGARPVFSIAKRFSIRSVFRYSECTDIRKETTS